jgi:membrane-associated phospholipid phosphatase
MALEFDGRAPWRRRGGAGRRAAAIVFAVVVACAGGAGAQELGPGIPPRPPEPDPPSFRAFGRGLGMSFTTSLFSERNLLPAVIGGEAALVLAPFDEDISSATRGTNETLGTLGDAAGGTIAMASIVGGTVTASLLSHSTRLKSSAFALAQATTVEIAFVESLKYITQRERPDGSDNLSFPSGHSAGAFTVAAVFSHYYGWKWGVPLYAAAGLVAVSRVEKGKHWPSDVAAGATIGLLAGRSGVLTTERFSGARKKLSRLAIAPMLGARCWGVSVSVLPALR